MTMTRRLQPECMPDTRCASQPFDGWRGCVCHLPRAPVSSPGELPLQRQDDDLLGLCITDLARLTGALGIEQPIQPQIKESLPPFAHHLHGHLKTLGDIPVQFAMRARRQYMRPRNDRARALAASRPFGQTVVLFHRQRQLRQLSARQFPHRLTFAAYRIKSDLESIGLIWFAAP